MNDGTLLFVNFAAYAWLLVVPVIALEARELRQGLNVTLGRAAGVSALANLASTLLATLAVFAAGTLLGTLDVIAEPQAGEGDVAVLVALVPCYFLSVWCETLVGAPLLKQVPRVAVRALFLRANLLSYAMVGIVPVGRFAKSLAVNGRIIW